MVYSVPAKASTPRVKAATASIRWRCFPDAVTAVAATPRHMRRISILVLVIAAIVGVLLWLRLQHGFSARDEPSAFERYLATAMRRAAVPRSARDARNPFPSSPEHLARAREHFADHCASCHANNGSGD